MDFASGVCSGSRILQSNYTGILNGDERKQLKFVKEF